MKVEADERGFELVVPCPQFTYHFRIDDPEAFYSEVTAMIGPWLAEKNSARLAFACSQKDVDESGGYEPISPKHPHWHSIHADLYDQREGK